MYCPIRFHSLDKCELEKCSWWDGKQCAILSMAKSLNSIKEAMKK
jgi:hypothetical protein